MNKINSNFTESYFLNTVKSFDKIDIIDNKINELNKLFLPIQNNKDRNLIRSLLIKYAIITYYTKRKIKDIVSEFNNKVNKQLFLPEYIEDIRKIENDKLTVIEYYNINDRDKVLKVEEDIFFLNCQTDIIEVVEDNKNVYTTNDLMELFDDETNRRQNMDIVDNLMNMLNSKYENNDVFADSLINAINNLSLIPITQEFKIINDINNATSRSDKQITINKMDYYIDLFNKHINSIEFNKDFIINQTDLLLTINKYENNKNNNETMNKNLEVLKYFFNSDYLNYASNDKYINFKNNKQFISFRISKLKDYKNIIRICSKDKDVIIKGFVFLTDKEVNDKTMNNIEEFKELILKYNCETFDDVSDLLDKINKKSLFLSIYLFNNDAYNETADILNLLKNKKFKVKENIKEDYVKVSDIDNNELILYGYNEKTKKLPKYEIDDKIKRADNNDVLEENNNIVCQHIIDKRELEDLKRKKSFIKYEFLSYQFIKKYITRDFNGNRICKSCSEKIEIKGLSDNAIDSIDNLDVINYNNLENMHEYAQFGKTKTSDGLINNIDTIITDFGNILNIYSYSGFTFQQINIRKKLIKETIDIIQNIKKILTIQYKEIKDFIPTIIKKYNLNIQNNDYYIFKLDNSIYETSKQDYYQNKKKNNIIYYIIFNFILNLTSQNLIDILNKRLPLIKNSKNIYEDYKKHRKIFENIEIIFNGEKIPILNLEVLCFYIYVISRILSQEKYKNKIVLNVEYKNISIQAQLIIINSILTLLDTVLDCIDYIKHKKTELLNNHLLNTMEIQNIEIIESKLNNQFKNIFNNIGTVNKFYTEEVKVIKDKENIIFEDIRKIKDNTNLSGFNNDPQNKQDGNLSLSYNNNKINNQDIQNYEYIELNEPKELFHDFVYDSNLKEMKCKICGLTFSEIKKTKKKDNKKLIFNHYLENRNKTFCPDGTIHKFDNGECKKCGYIKGKETINETNKNKLYKSLQTGNVQVVSKMKKFNEDFIFEDIEILNRKKRNKQIIKKLADLSNIIINTFGNVLILKDKKINVKNNTYHINYDYKGNVADIKVNQQVEKFKLNGLKTYKLKSGDVDIFYNYHLLTPFCYQSNKNIINIEKVDYKQSLIIDYSFINIVNKLFDSEKFIIFNNFESVYNYIDNFSKSLNYFKQLLNVYIQKILFKFKFIIPNNDNKLNDEEILDYNNLMFDIRQYYDKFDKNINVKKLFEDRVVLNDIKDKLNFIEFNKIYETKKINQMINSINLKLLIFFNGLLETFKINNMIFNDFLIKFIYSYYNKYSKNDNVELFIIFKNGLNSEYLTITDKTKIKNVNIEIKEEEIEELKDKLDNKENENKEDNEDYETLDIDYDVENEDDIDYEDNDEF